MEKGKDEVFDAKVLYVEDEEDIREGIMEMLSRKIRDLHVATNGLEGLETFQVIAPDIVITDIRMPRMSGIEMARAIKQLKPNVQIIVTSAYSDINYFIESIDIGINQYVLKPVTRERLFMAIEKAAHIVNLQKQVNYQMDTIFKLHSAIDQSQSVVVIADENGVIQYVNKRYEEVTGYTQEEAKKLGLKIFQLSGNLVDLEEELKAMIAQGKVWKREYQTLRKNGEKYWEYASITPIKNEQGETISFVKVAEDITELRKVSEALVVSEQKHRNMIENLGEGIGVLDLTYSFIFANPALKTIFEQNDLEDVCLTDFVEKQDILKLKEQARLLQKTEKFQMGLGITTPTGRRKNLNLTITPQYDLNVHAV
ncbi:MAG: PAS domain S-box protein, partial [Fibrobacter sp.]|nr:PAS domain S-box protein [Fibrobacter sp.]